jgi:cellulose synthase/poly-beta-1,6-N-acetylglucosamine synthase-like glycosyltransferase
MIWFAVVSWTLFGIVVVVLAALSSRFVIHYRQPIESISDNQLPTVGVLMTLRGADPFLEKCLRQLFCIDYPRHQIRIIVDSDLDPAFALVNKVRDELDPSHVGIEILTEHGENCSLLMGALNQGIAGFSDDVEIIAWLDADAIPYSDWLRDLVAPFADAKVGAACGYRWFVPPDCKPGSLVRYLWNAASIAQMQFFQIGWGGSYAIRRSVFNELEIGEKWNHVLFEECNCRAGLCG